jgi:hypothetical protein
VDARKFRNLQPLTIKIYIMKDVTSFLVIALFMALYYLVWILTLPFSLAQLFISVAADDDDSNVMTSQRS